MKEKRKIIMCLCLLFSAIGDLSAQEAYKRKWYAPGYYKIQYAGNIGFMSIGLGYSWWRERVQSTFIYGYVPETEGNATIHTFTIKNDFRLYQFLIADKYYLQPTLGFSLSLEPGENSYLRVPDRYPEGYYSSNSFYACINAGLKTNFKFKEERYFSSIDIYVEMNTLADYIYYNIIAQEDRSNNIGSLALGVNVFF